MFCTAYFILYYDRQQTESATQEIINFMHWSMYSLSHNSCYSYTFQHVYCAHVREYQLLIINFNIFKVVCNVCHNGKHTVFHTTNNDSAHLRWFVTSIITRTTLSFTWRTAICRNIFTFRSLLNTKDNKQVQKWAFKMKRTPAICSCVGFLKTPYIND
jgi:hypothetical protein